MLQRIAEHTVAVAKKIVVLEISVASDLQCYTCAAVSCALSELPSSGLVTSCSAESNIAHQDEADSPRPDGCQYPDLDSCREGVTYCTVRRVHILDVPSDREHFVQSVGRARKHAFHNAWDLHSLVAVLPDAIL